jgi:hypothetical protein
MLIYLVVSSTKDLGGTRFFFFDRNVFRSKFSSIKITLFIIEFFVYFINKTSKKTTKKKFLRRIPKYKQHLLKISILKNTPTNWRLLHRNFSNDK